ncbi:hypothetical protein CkaCkLH20_09124 [Colletotrichum karsti]|uniref:Uncharacterized protein n=1 Tax=Colletotrichum karsti TaxID=1095194 RepID=A0A9P6I1S7_9PEZI|nr:uncharacterized protein CkaCkLH20_09124 [Colletotrichum karsti]KAF9873311.1 hypothetical protein CkaCkLH20_09124 [Colletotrichum karsti]
MLKLRILLAFCLAFIAVIATFSHDDTHPLANSTNPLTSSIKAQHLATSRQIPSDSEKRAKFRVGGEIDSLGTEKSRARRHHGKEMMHIWARQNSTPSTDPSVSLATVTITRTAFVEVASETQVFVSTLLQTLTFVDPILVTETSTITVSPPPSGVAKRHVAAPVISPCHDISASDSVSSSATATPDAVSPVAVRRQVPNGPVTVIGLVSVVTIETTVTLTRTGSFVSTATVVNPVFVSVTATPTVTTTRDVYKHSTASNLDSSFVDNSYCSPAYDFFISVPNSGHKHSCLDDQQCYIELGRSQGWGHDLVFLGLRRIYLYEGGPNINNDPDHHQLYILFNEDSAFHVHIPEDDYQMTSAVAAAAMIDSMPSNPAMPHDRSAALASETSGNSSLGDEVRVIIQPSVNRRTQSSSLFPVTKTWPRPPGYTGDTYSFSADESGQSTPQEPKTWSNASEYGGSSNREGLPGSGNLGSAAAPAGEREAGMAGEGSRF